MQLLSDNSAPKVLEDVKKLSGLQIEKVKLQLTEQLTLILSKVLLAAIIFVMIVAAVIFLTIACAQWLKGIMNPLVAYSIVAVFHMVVAALVFMFRRQWIIDPIARFLSRIILDPPSPHRQSHTTSNNPSALTNRTQSNL